MNEGQLLHPMHLHGMPQLVIAKDGYLQPQPWLCDTLTVSPGERWDVVVDATEVGTWAFHSTSCRTPNRSTACLAW